MDMTTSTTTSSSSPDPPLGKKETISFAPPPPELLLPRLSTDTSDAISIRSHPELGHRRSSSVDAATAGSIPSRRGMASPPPPPAYTSRGMYPLSYSPLLLAISMLQDADGLVSFDTFE